MENSGIEIYQLENGKTEITVRLDQDTVWLSLMQMTELFQHDKSVISRHIRNIYKEKELEQEATVAKFATVQREGNRAVLRDIEFFNLDVIISVGYRIKSQRGTQFRIWASRVLKEHLIKGYSINEKQIREKTQNLKELQRTVKLLGSVIQKHKISGEEGEGLLKIVSD